MRWLVGIAGVCIHIKVAVGCACACVQQGTTYHDSIIAQQSLDNCQNAEAEHTHLQLNLHMQ